MAQAKKVQNETAFLWGEIELDDASGPKGKTPISHRRTSHKTHAVSVPECGQRQSLHCLQKPPLYQEPSDPPALELRSDHMPRDYLHRSLILHSIDLCQYIREMNGLADQKREEGGTTGSSPNSNPVPDFPAQNWKSEGPAARKLPRMPDESHRIVLPAAAEEPKEAKDLLRQGMLTQCMFTGYHASQPRAVDLITDVAAALLGRLSAAVHTNSEHLQQGRQLGFKDPIEQSLWECAGRGREGLHHYWQTSVVRYSSLLTQKAVELRQDYQRLTAPPPPPALSSTAQHQRSTKKRLPSVPSKEAALLLEDGQDVSDEEELPLDTLIQQAAELKSPDSLSFTPHPTEAQETFDFSLDGPARKRLRTSSSSERDRRPS